MFLSWQQPVQALLLTPCCLEMITLLLFTNKRLWTWGDKHGVQGSTLIANCTHRPWSNFTTSKWVTFNYWNRDIITNHNNLTSLSTSRKYLDSPCICGNTSLASLWGENKQLTSRNLYWVEAKITPLVLMNIVLFCEVFVKHLWRTGLGVLSSSLELALAAEWLGQC